MTGSRQQAYLEAMGIDVWRLRNVQPAIPEPAHQATGIKLGPGSGGVLFVCAAAGDSSSPLATDIARALGAVPVWAWPQPGEGVVGLQEAVDEHLFTTVAIFGEELAGGFFPGPLPASLNSARLVLLPSLEEIREQAEARRTLWQIICKNRMVSAN